MANKTVLQAYGTDFMKDTFYPKSKVRARIDSKTSKYHGERGNVIRIGSKTCTIEISVMIGAGGMFGSRKRVTKRIAIGAEKLVLV